MVTQEKHGDRYSYSKLTSFGNCKLGYKKRYIDGEKGVGNCFSSYGTLLHSLLERHLKGEMPLSNIVDTYKWEFPIAVPEPFPSSKFCPDMKSLYYKQGLEFLKKLKGFGDMEILEIEGDFIMPLYDWELTGVIDLLYIDKRSGKMVLRDWKSKASFKSKKEAKEYRRQLYLYCFYIKHKYGKFPDELQFYLMRKDNIVKTPFDKDEYISALGWARATVEKIRNCWSYPFTYNEFFCTHLCNHRFECEHSAIGE